MTDKLKPCPFCGQRLISIIRGAYYFAKCVTCGAISAQRETEKLAEEVWNTRAGPEEEFRDNPASPNAILSSRFSSYIQQTPSILDDRVFARMLDCAVASNNDYAPEIVCRGADEILAERKRRESKC